MSIVDHKARSIYCRLVYVGPEGSGKTANLNYIHERTNRSPTAAKPPMPSQPTEQRFFDGLSLTLGVIREYTTQFHLFTVPGAPEYAASRLRLVMGPLPEHIPPLDMWSDPRTRGIADGLVFVADARPSRMAANLAAWSEVRSWMQQAGVVLGRYPLVVQCNQSDASDALTPNDMATRLHLGQLPIVSAVATTGVGVFETLKAISKAVLVALRDAPRGS